MNGQPGKQALRIRRRDLLASAGVAGAVVALPRMLRRAPDATKQDERAGSDHFWFEHQTLVDRYIAYRYELEEDGTLWVEYDDGYLHAFGADEWKLVEEEAGHRLWLQEADGVACGYWCLTGSEADEQLEDVA